MLRINQALWRDLHVIASEFLLHGYRLDQGSASLPHLKTCRHTVILIFQPSDSGSSAGHLGFSVRDQWNSHMPQPQQTAAMFYGKAPDEASRSGIPPAIIESFAAVSRETAASRPIA